MTYDNDTRFTKGFDDRITPREASILSLAAEGMTDKQIALELKLSVGTVRTYWSRIRIKLRALTRAQAVGVFSRTRGLRQQEEDSAASEYRTLSKLACSFWGTCSFSVRPADGLVTFLDDQAEEALGVTEEGLQGRQAGWISIFEEEQRPHLRKIVQKALGSAESIMFVTRAGSNVSRGKRVALVHRSPEDAEQVVFVLFPEQEANGSKPPEFAATAH
ncbi:MAG: hypothetical protein KIT11_10100 [Fimbriimonadaceae bacterium]|nr:hypothetical protein [Fimbriimonadaceae bacterium]QYK55675.1 MAG: hypothetical protein KF733_11770 [Fimbriimonadaceae bacterium]